MANVKMTNIAINNSIDLFINHWQYGFNYEDSTILLDPSYNIIAFFDRGTNNIDAIMADIPFEGGFIINNGEPFEIKGKIKYMPYDYEMAMNKYAIEIWDTRGLKDKEKLNNLYNKIKSEVSDYNINYFKDLINNI